MKYNTNEVCKLTGLSLPKIKDLLRDSKQSRIGTRLFWPSYPSQGKRQFHYYSEEDISLLKAYKEAVENHKRLLANMRKIAKRRLGNRRRTASE